MVLLDIPDEMFWKFVSDLDIFSDKVIMSFGDKEIIAETDSKYTFRLLDEEVVKQIELLKNTDHILLLKQLKVLSDLGEYSDSIMEIDRTVELEQLPGIGNLLGVIHDFIHANDPSIPDPDDGCQQLLDS